jgi:hypothetical protein
MIEWPWHGRELERGYSPSNRLKTVRLKHAGQA